MRTQATIFHPAQQKELTYSLLMLFLPRFFL